MKQLEIILLFVASFMSIAFAAVKVYMPTGPNTNTLVCYEYSYVRFKVSEPKLQAACAYFDLDLLQDGRLIERISQKAPFIKEGYVAFYPWNQELAGKAYKIGMKFYDEAELPCNSFSAYYYSPTFEISRCPDDEEVAGLIQQ